MLQSYPLSRQAIVKEAREDIPPFYRARIWAALLRVDASYPATYAAIEKEKSHSSDRQVYLRCSAYNARLANILENVFRLKLTSRAAISTSTCSPHRKAMQNSNEF